MVQKTIINIIILSILLLFSCNQKKEDINQIYTEKKIVYDTISITEGINIGLLKNNFFYIGIDNPVEISFPEKYDSINVRIIPDSVGTIKKSLGDTYIVKAKKHGRIKIEVSINKNHKKQVVLEKQYRAKHLPDPIPFLGLKRGGIISKTHIMNLNGIRASLINMDIQINYKIIGFTISTINKEGEVIESHSNSSKFTKEQKEQINNLVKGDKIYFENIIAKGPSGKERKLNIMMFKIK